jgi:CRISPR/Cas system CSM-associated protein Csm3 (group 7 of RAMP superfamily)
LFLLEQTEDLRFEDLSAVVDILDNIDQVERKELMMLAQTIIPTGNLEALEIMIDLQSQPTKTSLKNAIDYVISKKKREQKQQQEQAMMQQAIMQDAAAQQSMEQQAMGIEANMEMEDTKQENAIERELIKASAKTPPSMQAPQ